ncbi:MAG TPA: tetratricopeptide repeat protein [Miltoncostaeales bacterium]|jgi:tetratricopeptide (TPR) repeat protein|nr:tetratricopeptide repeat protein [Miltoncostaeales bacterium]
MSEASQPDRRVVPARVAIALGVWAVLVALVAVVASGLTNDPRPAERASAPDPNLPPLTLTLDRDLPAEAVAAASAAKQVDVLQNLAIERNTPQAWVDLGAARHYQQDYAGAILDYRRALALDPNRLDAQVGLLIVDAATVSGRDRSAPLLAKLATRHPQSQLVAFNQGMVAVYREDRETANAAFAKVQAIDPASPLGKVAERLTTAAGGNTNTK